MKVFEANPFQVLLRWQTFDAVSILVIGSLKVPEPVLTSVGEDDKRCVAVFSIAAGLFFSIVRVQVLTFRLKHAEGTADFVLEDVVGATCGSVVLKNYLPTLRVQQVPTTVGEGLVNKDSGKSLVMVRGIFRCHFFLPQVILIFPILFYNSFLPSDQHERKKRTFELVNSYQRFEALERFPFRKIRMAVGFLERGVDNRVFDDDLFQLSDSRERNV